MKNGRNNLLPFFCNDVSERAWNFPNDSMGPKQTQAMRDPGRETPFYLSILGRWEQMIPKVSISKSLDFKFSSANRFQEEGVFWGPGAKRPNALTFPMRRATNRLHNVSQRAVHRNRSQGIQIPFIRGLREFSSSMEVGNPFAHSLPGKGSLRVSLFGPIHFKIPGVVQGGFHAQDTALFIIDFQGVRLEFVLQTDSFRAVPIVTDHLSQEVSVGFLAPKTEDILAAKRGNPPADQSRINPGQGGGRAEEDIGGPFTLVGRPIVGRPIGGQHFFLSRVQLPGNPIQDLGPIRFQLLSHQPLGLVDILNPRETVLTSLVGKVDPVHLAGQPFPAIETNLNGEREPALDAGMHEPKNGVDPVMIEKQTLPPPRLEFQFLLPGIPEYFITLARLHRGQNTNQAFRDSVLLGDLPSHFLFVRLGRVQIQKGPVQFSGLSAGGRFQLFTLFFEEGTQVFQQNPDVPEIVPHSALHGQNPQGPSQNQTVEPTQMTDDIFLILLYKLFHGALFLSAVGVVEDSNHTRRTTPFPY